MTNPSDKRCDWTEQSGSTDNLRRKLDGMSAEELTEAMNLALDMMTEDTYSSELIDAYLDALERKAPIENEPDVDEAYAGFQRHLRQLVLDSSDASTAPVKPHPSPRLRKMLRIGLVAAITIICMLGCMIVAQAAGVDVFGAMARWTDDVFSFGKVISDGAVDTPLNPSDAEPSQIANKEGEYTTLQDALDALGIVEVHEPSWFPEEYSLREISVRNVGDQGAVYLHAGYTANEHVISFVIRSYADDPGIQIEKKDTPVETFASGETVFYLMENTNNYTVAWATEQFVCYIAGNDPDVIRQIALSIY